MNENKKTLLVLLLIAGLMGILVSLDLVADYGQGASLRHLLAESLLLSLSLVAFVFSLQRLIKMRSENQGLLVQVQGLNTEKEKWKAETADLLKGLSSKIEKQFSLWKLSPAETEVGFLLLKGFSLKEIAEIRGTKLKTIEQQAQSIYFKTKTSNRSELSAFFLEDLLPPLRQ